MSFISRMRKQKAVWWERSATPDASGTYTFGNPVEIDCRWVDRVDEFVNAQGQEQTSKSKVYVDREMKPGDWLRLGELESDMTNEPFDHEDAYEIQRFDRTPNLKATKFLLTAYL